MMDVKQIREWMATLPDDAEIGVDDGGLCLRVEGNDAYLEIGGMPQGDDEELCECGRRPQDCKTFDGGDIHGELEI